MHICKYINISENKGFEFELSKNSYWSWFEFRVAVTRARDHAGAELYLEVGPISLSISLQDKRHWDYNNDRWMEYEDLHEMQNTKTT